MATFRIILSGSIIAEAPTVEDDKDTSDEPIEE